MTSKIVPKRCIKYLSKDSVREQMVMDTVTTWLSDNTSQIPMDKAADSPTPAVHTALPASNGPRSRPAEAKNQC